MIIEIPRGALKASNCDLIGELRCMNRSAVGERTTGIESNFRSRFGFENAAECCVSASLDFIEENENSFAAFLSIYCFGESFIAVIFE